MYKRKAKSSWCKISQGAWAAVCLFAFFLCAQAGFAQTFTFQKFNYQVKTDGTAALTGAAKDFSSTEIIVPDWAYDAAGEAYAVTEVVADAFKNVKTITRVVIGDNVTTIGNKAFEHFGEQGNNLVLILGKSVTSLDDKAFEHFGEHGTGNKVILKGVKVPPAAAGSSFEHVKNTTFYVKDETTYGKFAADKEWSKYDNKQGNKYAYPYPAELTLKGGQWQTAVFPEEMDADKVASLFGQNTKLAGLSTGRGSNNKNGYVLFFYTATKIERNKPMLIKPGNKEAHYVSDAEYGIGSPSGNPVVTRYAEELNVNIDMVGACYDDYNLEQGEIYFRNEDGNMHFYRADDDNIWVRRGRCYFRIVPKGAAQDTKNITLDYQIEGETTAIRSVHATSGRNAGHAFSLTGQDEGTDTARLPKGIHIVDGRKIVVK